jgi:hypothetical protein
MNIITIFIVVVWDMWINIKKNGGYLWFQEEPRVKGNNNNNRVTQVEPSQQVGTWYLYLLYLIIIFFTSY